MNDILQLGADALDCATGQLTKDCIVNEKGVNIRRD